MIGVHLRSFNRRLDGPDDVVLNLLRWGANYRYGFSSFRGVIE